MRQIGNREVGNMGKMIELVRPQITVAQQPWQKDKWREIGHGGEALSVGARTAIIGGIC